MSSIFRQASLTRNAFLIVPTLLLAHLLLAASSAATKSCTFDELAHVTAGTAYWLKNDYRLQPENGNLPQRLAGLLPALLPFRFPECERLRSWHVSDVGSIGRTFFYESQNDADRLLLWSRATMALVSVSLGATIYGIARSLLGVAPATLALLLFAFCPTMLANGPLATSDTTAALFFLLAVWRSWQLLRHVSLVNLVLSTLSVAGLFLSKYSAPLVIPMIAILVIIRLAAGGPISGTWRGMPWTVSPPARQLGIILGITAAHVVVAWIAVWLAYGLRYDAFAGSQPGRDRLARDWQTLLDDTGAVGTAISACRTHRLLPEAYLFGYAFTYKMAQQRVSFLNGEFGLNGWRTFFPYCLLVKTPLTLFLLIALGCAALCRRRATATSDAKEEGSASIRPLAAVLYDAAPLAALFVVYWAAAIPSHLNIGHRHILPTYPPMFILAGAATDWWRRKTTIQGFAVAAATALFVAESLTTAPNYLAYFNQIVGGPTHAYRHLVDSSLDWGQDLPALKRWLDDHAAADTAADRVYVSYFGSALPQYYGIKAVWLPCFFEIQGPYEPPPLKAGTYCISATMLQNIYSRFPPPWRPKYEELYRQVQPFVEKFHDTAGDPAAREALIAEYGRAEWAAAFQTYEQVRFAKLCHVLQNREPDAIINFSILVYRVAELELDDGTAMNTHPKNP